MNNQIRKLAEESGLLPDSQWPGVQTRYMKKKAQDLEKFAQLIIEECIREISHKSVELLDTELVAHYKLRLKHHFGVN